jgi:phosphomannomutase
MSGSDQKNQKCHIHINMMAFAWGVQSLGGVPVVGVRDLGTGLDTSARGGKTTLPWTAGDMMITYTLEGGGTLTVRASGTEPKLKYYLEVQGLLVPGSKECRFSAFKCKVVKSGEGEEGLTDRDMEANTREA